jgi:HEAT repeat protein
MNTPHFPSMFEMLFYQLRGFRFDMVSALIGAAVAGLVAYALYRLRDRLAALRGGLARSARRTRERAVRTADVRYRESVISQANRWHIAGHFAPLEAVAVLPHFLPMPPTLDPIGTEVHDEGPLNLVPCVHDCPYVAGPYELPGVGFDRVLRGDSNVAVLGPAGSGKSVALALMAIVAARQTEEDQEGAILRVPRTPVLCHLGDVDLSPERLGECADPATPLIEAASKRMTGVGARIAPGVLGTDLADGCALVLLDGLDELPPAQRRLSLAWVRALIDVYPDNKYVIAGPVRGYTDLLDLRFAPVFIRPWGQRQFDELAERWAAIWQQGARSRRGPTELSPEVVHQARLGNRARTPLDVTLKIWSLYSGQETEPGRLGWYEAYVARSIPVPEARQALVQMAAQLMQESEHLGLPEDQVHAHVDAVLAPGASRLKMDVADLLFHLTHKTRLLVERAGRLNFAHPTIGGFFAAQTLAEAEEIELPSPSIIAEQAIAFLAPSYDMHSLIHRQIAAQPDVLQTPLSMAAGWAADAPLKAMWRNDLFNQLAQVLLGPDQFPLVRERALAALIASRDPNVVFVFRQGLKSPDGRVRALSALGLGALSETEAVGELAAGLKDPDQNAQIASVLALGAIGSEAAWEYLVQTLVNGSEPLRRAVAEVMATDPDRGHPLLHEAIGEEDIMTRRAAVYGLTRVGQDWAVALLEEREVQDDEWYVRAAASQALERFRGPSDGGPRPAPAPHEVVWLITWAEERGQNVPEGPDGIQVLIQALQEGNQDTRIAAAQVLGAMASREGIQPLYAALLDRSPEVRDTAYRALGRISEAFGCPLPSV